MLIVNSGDSHIYKFEIPHKELSVWGYWIWFHFINTKEETFQKPLITLMSRNLVQWKKNCLLAFKYFICNSLNSLLINPGKLSLSYKQATWRHWVYDWEKILLGCPTAQGLGLIQECISLDKSIERSKPRSSDPENSQFPLAVQAAWQNCSAAASPAIGQAACQGLALPEMAQPCSLSVPRPQGFTGLWQILIP